MLPRYFSTYTVYVIVPIEILTQNTDYMQTKNGN